MRLPLTRLLAVSIFSALTFTLSTPESFAECSGSEVTTVEGGSDNSDLGASASKKSRCSASTDDRSSINPSRIVSNIQYITRTVESGVGYNCISDGSGGQTCFTDANSCGTGPTYGTGKDRTATTQAG